PRGRRPVANHAKEPTCSLGADSPLPRRAGRPRPVHHYLRQRFAQVTTPPIDHLRERLVMSLRTMLGPRQPILTEGPEAARLLTLRSFFVYPTTVDHLADPEHAISGTARLDATFAASKGPGGLREAVASLCDEAEKRVAEGIGVIIV